MLCECYELRKLPNWTVALVAGYAQMCIKKKKKISTLKVIPRQKLLIREVPSNGKSDVEVVFLE